MLWYRYHLNLFKKIVQLHQYIQNSTFAVRNNSGSYRFTKIFLDFISAGVRITWYVSLKHHYMFSYTVYQFSLVKYRKNTDVQGNNNLNIFMNNTSELWGIVSAIYTMNTIDYSSIISFYLKTKDEGFFLLHLEFIVTESCIWVRVTWL